MPKPTPNKIRQKIVDNADKFSVSELAEKYKRDEKTVRRILKRAGNNGGNADYLPTGGDRKSLENEWELVEYAIEQVKSGALRTSKAIAKAWKKVFDVDRSDSFVRDILKKYDFCLSDWKVTKSGKSGKVKSNRKKGASGKVKSNRKKGASCKVKSSRKKGASGKQKLLDMKNFLTKKEIDALNKIIKKRGINENIKNRCRVILALNKGESIQSVMNCLQLTRQTVRKYLCDYLEGGLEKLKFWGYSGMRNHCKTTLKQDERIKKYLRKNPTTNMRDLRAWIYKKFGITYSKSGVHRLVRRLGFRYRKSKRLPRLPPLEVQRKWLEGFNNAIATSPAGTVVLYLDGFHPRLQGDPRGCWVEDGMTPVLEQATSRDGLNVLGALNTDSGKFTYLIEKTLDKFAVVKMLEKIKEEYPDAPNIIIVLDNASYHKADDVKDWLANQSSVGPHIQFHFLPAYCPHFNLIERLWKKFREEVTHNNVQEDLKNFILDSLEFLDGVEKNWHKHVSYVKIELKPIDPDNEKYLHVNRSLKKSAQVVSEPDNSQVHSIQGEDAMHMHQGAPP